MNLPPLPCPQCGSAIPEGAPQGICPRCLLRNAMNPTVVQQDTPVPPPEEIVRAFPNLEILQLIGAGGMGRVYKVRQPHLDRIVALKILQPELAGDPAFAERFTREGRALAKLTHPNIVSVYDFGKAGEFYWLLMEYVDGVNLRQAMQAGTMTPREALQIVPMICAALEYAHNQGVLHRDIKPENILIDTQGRVKIADFGVAKMRGDAGRHITLTLSGSALGTPAYMAPEQIERPQDVDHRADIYSLGVVFYEMLTGELPLGRFLAPSEKAGTDPRLDSVVFRTLEKERDRRYQSAGEMKTQVETYASAPAPAVRHKEERVSRKAVWAFVLVVLGAVLGFAMLAGTMIVVRQGEIDSMREQSNQYPRTGVRLSPGGSIDLNVGGNAPLDHGPRGLPVIMMLVALLPLAMFVTGTSLGVSALKDIRASGGKLGGAVRAVFASTMVPAILIIILTSGAFMLIGDELAHGTWRRAGDIWPITGAIGGCLLAFLLMRKVHRFATGWDLSVTAGPLKAGPNATVAICATVTGAALVLISLVLRTSSQTRPRGFEALMVLTPLILLVAIIFGVLSRREAAGRTCATLSTILFIFVVLLFFA